MTIQRRLTDPRDLQALAHPLRLAVVELLAVHGPLTATELAEHLDETPANCSWHLRKLAQHGFVTEAPAPGGRRRPWQVTAEALVMPDDGSSPAASRAGAAVERVLLARSAERFLTAPAGRTAEDLAQRTLHQATLWLTPDETAELHHAIGALLAPYADRARDADARPRGARPVELVSWTTPIEDVPLDGERLDPTPR